MPKCSNYVQAEEAEELLKILPAHDAGLFLALNGNL